MSPALTMETPQKPDPSKTLRVSLVHAAMPTWLRVFQALPACWLPNTGGMVSKCPPAAIECH